MRESLDLVSPALSAYIQANQYDYKSYEDFLSLPVPEGVSHEEVWDLLSFVRSIQGRPQVESDCNEADGLAQRDYWVATPAMVETFTRLAYYCVESAPLVQDLEKPKSRELLQDLLIEELWAASIRDGLSIEREVISALVHGEAVEPSEPELVLANCLRILERLAEVASDQHLPLLTIDDLLAMYSALSEQIATFSAEPLKTLANDMPLRSQELSAWLTDIVINVASPYHWGPHPMFSMLMNADIFWEMRPFGQFDGLMELVVWHYMCLYHRVPALRFVPLSKMRLDWEHGLMAVDSPIFEHGNAIIRSRYGIDSTPYVQLMTKLLDRGVERLQAIARKACELDAAHKEAIAADGRLTLRQKSLLQSLVDDPNRTFTLVDYQQRFDIALSTARADVEGLINMRWLEDEFEGKRRIYRLRKN